jgi:hypothetical protein
MTMMRLAVDSTSPRRWEMRMQAPPPATNRRTKASNCPATWTSSEEVGSSRMTSETGVSVTEKARAISTI